jgi:hypothetical protein
LPCQLRSLIDVHNSTGKRIATGKGTELRLHYLISTGKGKPTILYEHQEWTTRAHGAGTVDAIPAAWKFSEQRIQELLTQSYTGVVVEGVSTPSKKDLGLADD